MRFSLAPRQSSPLRVAAVAAVVGVVAVGAAGQERWAQRQVS